MQIVKTPTTQNESWGFYGTMGEYAATAWPIAFNAVALATKVDDEAVRAFLDSRYGRHFADKVLDGLAVGHSSAEAIDAAVAQWMAWTIGRLTSRQYGIPKGMAYLTGFVVQAGLEDEAP